MGFDKNQTLDLLLSLAYRIIAIFKNMFRLIRV